MRCRIPLSLSRIISVSTSLCRYLHLRLAPNYTLRRHYHFPPRACYSAFQEGGFTLLFARPPCLTAFQHSAPLCSNVGSQINLLSSARMTSNTRLTVCEHCHHNMYIVRGQHKYPHHNRNIPTCCSSTAAFTRLVTPRAHFTPSSLHSRVSRCS